MCRGICRESRCELATRVWKKSVYVWRKYERKLISPCYKLDIGLQVNHLILSIEVDREILNSMESSWYFESWPFIRAMYELIWNEVVWRRTSVPNRNCNLLSMVFECSKMQHSLTNFIWWNPVLEKVLWLRGWALLYVRGPRQPCDEDIGMGQSQRKEGRKERSGQATSTTYHK